MRYKAFCFLFYEMMFRIVLGQTEPCGGDITSESGAINYPDASHMQFYGINEDCWWNLIADENSRWEISISYMDLQKHDECSADYLEIYDGDNLGASPVWKACGAFTADESLFKEQLVVLHFHSDDTVSGTGFTVEYRQIVGAQCGSTETYMIGTIESLDSDADGYYDNNITCFWSIVRLEVANNVTYQFYITRMDIEWTDGCYADYIELVAGEPDSYVGRYCGSEAPPLYIRESKYLYVKFHSDLTKNGEGFMAVYGLTDGPCGGILLTVGAEVGMISPVDRNNNGFYDNNLNCWWAIVAPKDSIMEYGFADIDIEDFPNCENDFVLVYDGGFEPDDFVWYNCGSAERYGPLYTKTNVLFVQFFSDDQPEEMYGGVYILYRNMNFSGNATTEPRMRSVPDEHTTPNIHAQSIGPTELNEHTTPNSHILSSGSTELNEHTTPNSHIQSIGPTETNEHTEPNHRTEPNENTEQSEYTEPNESTEPNQHTDRNEPSEQTGHTGKTTSGVTNDTRGTTTKSDESETTIPNNGQTSPTFVETNTAPETTWMMPAVTDDMSTSPQLTKLTTPQSRGDTMIRPPIFLLFTLLSIACVV